MASGFGIENSSINISNADLYMPVISAVDNTQVDFPGIEAFSLYLKQS